MKLIENDLGKKFLYENNFQREMLQIINMAVQISFLKKIGFHEEHNKIFSFYKTISLRF